MNLTQWGIKWGVPFEALDELRREFGTISTEPEVKFGLPGAKYDTTSEAAVQNNVRLEASLKGCRIWRNNVGAYSERKPPTPGTRWGLCNDSPQMNKVIKSADLIGIRPVVITPRHIGCTLGIFIARECKPGGWQYTATEHELAQLKFLELVAAMGGDASFVTAEGTL